MTSTGFGVNKHSESIEMFIVIKEQLLYDGNIKR